MSGGWSTRPSPRYRIKGFCWLYNTHNNLSVMRTRLKNTSVRRMRRYHSTPFFLSKLERAPSPCGRENRCKATDKWNDAVSLSFRLIWELPDTSSRVVLASTYFSAFCQGSTNSCVSIFSMMMVAPQRACMRAGQERGHDSNNHKLVLRGWTVDSKSCHDSRTDRLARSIMRCCPGFSPQGRPPTRDKQWLFTTGKCTAHPSFFRNQH